jgi:protocatechuate 3,4-dioxygenase beta subunit
MLRAGLALLAAAALAQQASVEGRVVNDVTGDGLSKAQVHLDSPGVRDGKRYVATTAPDGTYRFDNLAPATYTLWADRTGFVYPRNGRRRNDRVQVSVGATKAPDIRLSPHAAISGRIIDEDGDPVQGVLVHANRYAFSMGRRQLMPETSASTNDLGEFRIHGIVPGRYYLSAGKIFGSRGPGPPGREPERQGTGRDRQFATVFFPGVPDPATALAFDLAPGQDYRGANLTLPRVEVYKVSGEVSNVVPESSRRGGWPSAFVYLYPNSSARYAQPGDRRPAPIDVKTGKFEITGVRPGSYTAVAQQQGGPHSRVGHVDIEVGTGDLADVRLALQSSFDLQGRFVVDGGGPPPDLKAAAMQLVPVSSFATNSPTARTNADGTFQLKDTSPLRYRVAAASLPPGYWLKSVEWGSQEAAGSIVDFSAGIVSELVLKLAPGTGSISGVVRSTSGDGQPGLTVTLAPDSKFAAWFELYQEATSQQDGGFRFDNLRPGNYRVYAWERIDSGAHRDPDHLKPHESNSSPVSVEAGNTVTVHPKPIPTAAAGVL